ncbi:MAG: hypothetical protein ACJ8MR_01845 [Povalibacter sp.]
MADISIAVPTLMRTVVLFATRRMKAENLGTARALYAEGNLDPVSKFNSA